jgi:Xaa-Pro aminopeptidase
MAISEVRQDFASAEDLKHREVDSLNEARLEQLRATMRREHVPAVLTAHPVDIRYACGARNMTIFGLMSLSRFLLVIAEGPCILWEYYGCGHLAEGLTTLDDIREAPSLSYTSAGANLPAAAKKFAAEIASTAAPYMSSGGALAVDRLNFAVTDALRAEGFHLLDAGELFSKARRVKLAPEVAVMREAMRRVERATHEMRAVIDPGFSENEIWAHFHKGLIARDGEYVSTRLVAGGDRTFPYFREAGPNRLAEGSLLCFDTDTLGYLGYAVDFSRTFLCGANRGSAVQRNLYRMAHDQLEWNSALFRPGRSYREIAEAAWPIPEEYRATSYYCLAHGLGLSGEYPNVPHRFHSAIYPLEGEVESGMIICVESYIGSGDAHQGVKLEDQFLMTDGGAEKLSHFPFEDALLDRIL